jgi:hypothetical protein
MSNPTVTPLLAPLRAFTDEERAEFAKLSGTSESYLYQMATCKRPTPSARKALRIEDASKAMHKRTKHRTPIVSMRDIATMCEIRAEGK